MSPDHMIDVLEAAAAQLAVRVRYESLGGGGGTGGLCRLREQWQVIIDKKAGKTDRTAVLIDALSMFDTESISLPPKVREAVDARRAAREARVAAPPLELAAAVVA